MRIPKKRRLAAKTDYSRRIKLLKSDKPRLVFRRTNKYILAQYILSESAQDTVKKGTSSIELLKYGWPTDMAGSLKSITASYLTGYLIGTQITKEKLETPIVDFGMLRMIHKTKTFAFLNGIVDAGVKIECAKENFPEKERIIGKNLKKDFSKTFETIKLNITKK
jgi:large subunit ribosomal protein L18